MADTDILFPILQFTALVAPAMAILMQVLAGEDEAESPAFRFLEVGVLAILFGGLLILIQLLGEVNNYITQFSVILIMGSLLASAAGVGWRAIPYTKDTGASVSSFSDLTKFSSLLIGRIVGLSIPFIPATIYFYYGKSISQEYLLLGLSNSEWNTNIHLATTLWFLFIAVRVIIYLANVGYLTQYSNKDILQESIGSTLGGYGASLILASPPFIIAEIVEYIPILIEKENTIFLISYLWAILVTGAIFSIDIMAEKEGEKRIAEDD